MKIALYLAVVLSIAAPPLLAQAQTGPQTTAAPEAAVDRAAILLRTAEHVAAEMAWLDQGFVYDRPPQRRPDATKVAALYNRLRHPPNDVLPEASWRFRMDGLVIRFPATVPATSPATTPATSPSSAPTTRPAARWPTVLWTEQNAFEPGPWSADDIRPLLRHADPKVRTLGIVLMYQLNRVDVLPDLAELAYDDAQTFPNPGYGSAAPLPPSAAQSWLMEKATVGDFARKAIAAYAGASVELNPLWFELNGRAAPAQQAADLKQRLTRFASARHPTLCTAALVIAMQRATQGVSPLPDDRHGRVQAVLNLLQQIDMPRRFFVALRLEFEERAGARYAPDYLLQLARQVPHELRLKAILGQPIDLDPDINDFGYRFFESHAAELFTTADADRFLAPPPDQDASWLAKPSPRSGLLLAAARVRPGSAEAILLPGIDAFKEDRSVGSSMRRDIAIELCLLGNDAGIARGIDWFFAVTPLPGSYGDGREWMLGGLQQRDPIRARHVIERIIRDDRLNTLGPASTRMILQAVQGYLGRPLASEEEIRDSYGIDEAQRDRKLSTLPAWHASLKATVDEWSKQ